VADLFYDALKGKHVFLLKFHVIACTRRRFDAPSRLNRELLDDLLSRRRDRQREHVKKPPKNTFLAKKRDEAYPLGRVKYKITVTRKASLLAGTQ
jgi:hypothetical protein